MRQLALILVLCALVGCQSNGGSDSAATESAAQAPSSAAEPAAEDAYVGVVVETMDAGGYTYVLVDTGDEEIWAAGPQQEMAVDRMVQISKSMAMPEFRSETLDRTFDLLYFVTNFGDGEVVRAHGTQMTQATGGDDPHSGMGGASQAPAEVDLSGIEAADQTVAAIFTDKDALAGDVVRVRGKVVKALSGIMGTNWLHIQDGSGEAGTSDLTVTSDTYAEVGSTVVVEGVLTIDKDFGSGYRYDVIIEGAKVTIE